jgi:hypothetical protein
VTLSDTGRAQAFAQESLGFLELLTISHASLGDDPLRFVNNTVNVTSRGNTYTAFPFKVTLPRDADRTAPSARLTIDNVSREIAQIIRSISTPPTVLIEIIRMDDFDAVEVSYPTFTLRNVTISALSVSGELNVDDMMREPYPQRSFVPSEYPGLF